MARSNQGGTRGFLRGKVANDLYQVTRKSNGQRVQIVRAVEDSRVNNNTLEQALARMRMALLMGALSDLKEIVDHSWQGVPYGQLSIAKFVQNNMPLVQADCRENWVSNNAFCYPVKGVKAMRIGSFLIASGTLQTPVGFSRGLGYLGGSWFPFSLKLDRVHPTFGDIRSALGLNAADYITLLVMSGLDMGSSGILNQGLQFVRLYLADNVVDDTVLSQDNIFSMFTYDGNTAFQVLFNQLSNSIEVFISCSPDGVARDGLLSSIVVSRWDGRQWCRNNAQFLANSGSDSPNFEYNAPLEVFSSWFPDYDPDDYDEPVYPGK